MEVTSVASEVAVWWTMPGHSVDMHGSESDLDPVLGAIAILTVDDADLAVFGLSHAFV